MITPITKRDARKGRSRITNDPMSGRGHIQHTAQGRRCRDLFEGLMARYGMPADVVTAAEVLALAELKVLAEGERLKLLKGKGDQTDLTRLENLIRHREQRLDDQIAPNEETAENWGDDLTQNVPVFVISETDAKL